MSAAKEKKVPGIVKFLIFVAIIALLYFFAWPFAKEMLDERAYETANENAEVVYNHAVSYVEGKTKNIESLSGEKIFVFNGSKESAESLSKYINVSASTDIDGTYYSVLIGLDNKVERVFWSKTNSGDDIIGAYPNPISYDRPEFISLADCVDLEK